jgi:hypothetical protein
VARRPAVVLELGDEVTAATLIHHLIGNWFLDQIGQRVKTPLLISSKCVDRLLLVARSDNLSVWRTQCQSQPCFRLR